MPKFLIAYCSDMHGNIRQYKKLYALSANKKANAVIIGGDITPKDGHMRTVLNQRKFIIEHLIPMIKKTNEKRCSTYIIMGNDDFKSNEYILKMYDKRGILHLIDRKSLSLNTKYNITGYSYVPPTPFIYKDWEKQDMNNDGSRGSFITEGVKSKAEKLVKTKINMQGRDTLQKDLERLDINKNTIFVCHSPPYGTSLDMTKSGLHVGSSAVKYIINKREPFISLHGHIHETVKMSGKFMEKLGKTLCITTGNDYTSKNASIILFDLYNIKKIKRIIV